MTSAKMKIKKGDKVVVLTGKDKGAKGEVLKVFPSDSKVLVQGVNMVKKHQRPTPTGAPTPAPAGRLRARTLPASTPR